MKRYKVVLTRSKKDGINWLKTLKKEGIDAFCIPVQIYRFCKIKEINLAPDSVILFTSTKGIEGFSKIAGNRKYDCIVLGEREEKKAGEMGFNVLFKPDFASSENLIEKIIKNLSRERGIIYPTSELYNKELEKKLKEYGFEVKVLVLYKPLKRKLTFGDLSKIKKSTDILFFSPSQVQNFFSQVSISNLKDKNFWAIGKKTEFALKKITICRVLNKPEVEEFLSALLNR